MKTTIIGIDISFRNAGIAVIERRKTNDGVVIIHPKLSDVITTSSFPHKKQPLNKVRHEINNIISLKSSIFRCIDTYEPDEIVIETPHFSQSASGAYAMGVCHAIIADIKDKYSSVSRTVILPQALKEWARTKRGEKKEAVKRRVQEYDCFSHIKNDNTLDAIAICLMKCDQISVKEHEDRNKNRA